MTKRSVELVRCWRSELLMGEVPDDLLRVMEAVLLGDYATLDAAIQDLEGDPGE